MRRYEFNLKTTIFILTVKFDLFIIFTYEFKLFLHLIKSTHKENYIAR